MLPAPWFRVCLFSQTFSSRVRAALLRLRSSCLTRDTFSSEDPLTRHSSSRAGRAMMIISFFTSWVTKATSELSERSWACGEKNAMLLSKRWTVRFHVSNDEAGAIIGWVMETRLSQAKQLEISSFSGAKSYPGLSGELSVLTKTSNIPGGS